MERDYKKIIYLGNLSRTQSQSGQVIGRGGVAELYAQAKKRHTQR